MTPRRGRALLINNNKIGNLPERHGSEVDIQNLEQMLSSFHFDVVKKANLTAKVTSIIITHCKEIENLF